MVQLNSCWQLIEQKDQRHYYYGATPDHGAVWEILKTYKEQDCIEKKFGFMKEQLVVNDLFLKTPSRIEAPGLVLVLSLLI